VVFLSPIVLPGLLQPIVKLITDAKKDTNIYLINQNADGLSGFQLMTIFKLKKVGQSLMGLVGEQQE
jgi:hypothetical protein